MIIDEKGARAFRCCVDPAKYCFGNRCMGWVPEHTRKYESLGIGMRGGFVDGEETGRGHCGRVNH